MCHPLKPFLAPFDRAEGPVVIGPVLLDFAVDGLVHVTFEVGGDLGDEDEDTVSVSH
jgi:hypothetical protein